MQKRKCVMKKLCAILLVGTLLCACEKTSVDSTNTGKKRDGKGNPTPTTEVEPTPTAEPTPTVASTPTAGPKPTQSPIPTPDPFELYDFYYDTPNQALMAFARYLDEKVKKAYNAGEELTLRYGIIYLNSDDTPELWWTENNSHADSVCICMYDGKNVVELGYYGEFGTAKYDPRCGMIVSEYAGMGTAETAIYGLDELKAIKLSEFISIDMVIEDNWTTKYSVRGYDCDEQTFLDQLAIWELDTYQKIDYTDGLTVVDEAGYVVSTTYTKMYDAFLKSCKEDPYQYGVPDDILEMLTGEWKIQGIEVDGYIADAKSIGYECFWILEPNGEAEYSEYSPNTDVRMGRMEYYPNTDIYADSDALWRVVIRDWNKSIPGYDHYLTILNDGTLYDYYVNFEKLYAACRWYVKQN